MDINRVVIAGRLARDPELRAMPSGAQICTMSVATNRVTRGDTPREETEYHQLVVFGPQGAACSQHLRKGDAVAAEGRLQTRSWESDGVKKYRTEVVADNVHFVTSSGWGGYDRAAQPAAAPVSRRSPAPAHLPRAINEAHAQEHAAEQARKVDAPPAPAEQVVDGIVYPDEQIRPEDIPF